MGGKGNGNGNGNGNGSKLLEILNVRVVGSRDKVLVMLHGFGTKQSAWKQVMPCFQRDHRVVLYNFACAGSVNPDHFDFRSYATLDGFIDDLLVVLADLRIDRCTLMHLRIDSIPTIILSSPEMVSLVTDLLGDHDPFVDADTAREEVEEAEVLVAEGPDLMFDHYFDINTFYLHILSDENLY